MRFWKKKKSPGEYLEITDQWVRRHLANGKIEEARWDCLGEVFILTTEDGPFAEDVFWVLLESGSEHGCVVPNGLAVQHHLLERLQRLPGFDNEAVIRASTSLRNSRFDCWRKTAEKGKSASN